MCQSLCVWWGMCVYVEGREYIFHYVSTKGLNSGCWTLQQIPLSAESSHWLIFLFKIKHVSFCNILGRAIYLGSLNFVCVWVGVCMWVLVPMEARAFGSSGTGIIGDREPPNLDSGNWRLVLCKGSAFSKPVSHVSSLWQIFSSSRTGNAKWVY